MFVQKLHFVFYCVGCENGKGSSEVSHVWLCHNLRIFGPASPAQSPLKPKITPLLIHRWPNLLLWTFKITLFTTKIRATRQNYHIYDPIQVTASSTHTVLKIFREIFMTWAPKYSKSEVEKFINPLTTGMVKF